MGKRRLGKSNIEVAPLMLGGNVFGWNIDEKTSFQILDAFMDAGFNFIDTADVYSAWKEGNVGGESESVIGAWMKSRGNRERVIVATKVGMELGPDRKGLSRAYILRAVEDSLRRLQTDYIDLYQSHKDDDETALAETLGVYDELVQSGKVRVIGASNYSGERLAKSLEVSKSNGFVRYESLQPHYNMYERAGYESDLEPVVVANNIGVIPYFSLASGFLTGKYRSEADFGKSVRGARMANYLNDRGYRILAALDQVAAEYGVNPAQVALGWLMARPGITAPIASATNIDQLHDLVSATRLNLGVDAIAILNLASSYDA